MSSVGSLEPRQMQLEIIKQSENINVNLKSFVFIDSKFLLKFSYKFNHFITSDILPQYNNPKIKFQENIEKGIIGAGSVIGNTIQIASYLGFSEIYLVGCDCNYKIPNDVSKWGDKIKNSDYTNKYIISNSDDPNHFISSYFGKGKHWHDPNVKRMISGHIQCLNGIKTFHQHLSSESKRLERCTMNQSIQSLH